MTSCAINSGLPTHGATATNTQTGRFSLLCSILREYSAKELARWANSSVRTAEKWRADITKPDADSLLSIMRNNDVITSKLLGATDDANRSDHLGQFTVDEMAAGYSDLWAVGHCEE